MRCMSGLPTLTAFGMLGKRPLPHLLIHSLEKKLSGSLALTSSTDQVTMLFIDGLVAKIRTASPVSYLGAVLYEMGFIDHETLSRTLLEVSSRKLLHGQILLEHGAITNDQLRTGLQELTLRKLAHACTTFDAAATFEFHNGVDLLGGYAQAELVLTDPMPAIWVGIRDNPPKEHVATVLARIDRSRLRLGTGSALTRFRLRPDERALAEQLLGDGRGVETLGTLQIMPRRASELLLYCLYITGQVDALAKPTPSQPGAAIPSAPPSRPSQPGAAIPSAPPSRRSQPSAASSSAPPSRRSPLSSQPESAVPSANRDRPRSAREQAILDRARTILQEDFSKRLSLGRDASVSQVTEAYALFSRPLHDYAAATKDEAIRVACTAVLDALAEARDTLTDPQKRSDYMLRALLGSAHRSKDEVAKRGQPNDLDAAKACFASGDLERAERLARSAHKANDKNPAALTLLAWIEAQRPTNKGADATKARIAMLTLAIELDPDFANAYYYRAFLLRRLGNHRAASADLRTVLRLEPDRRDAAHELRESEQAARKPTGLFERLLKK
jgi:tetratricopeptide (TPR) repeat protein